MTADQTTGVPLQVLQSTGFGPSINNLDSQINAAVSSHIEATKELGSLNTILNTTSYIHKEQSKEREALAEESKQLDNAIHVSQQQAAASMYQRFANKYDSITWLTAVGAWAVIVSMMALQARGAVEPSTVIMTAAVALVFFAFVAGIGVMAKSWRWSTAVQTRVWLDSAARPAENVAT
jgi:hypothetical protein